jgi:PAS domain S-box-containing protein
MEDHRRHALLTYGIAVLTSGLALLGTWLLVPLWTQTPLPLFFAAVVISAWWGGLGPGLVALAVGILLLDLLVLPPGQAYPFDLASAIQLGVFALVALLITSLQCQRQRAERALAARVRQQAALAKLSQAALAGLDLDSLFAATVARVAETLEVEFCKVLELLPDGQALRLRAGVGWPPGAVGQATVAAGPHSQAGYTLRHETPVLVTDLRTEGRFQGAPLLRDHGVVSGVSVVIQGGDRPFGVFGAHTRRQRTFTAEDVHLLQAVAGMLAQAIARKAAEAALQKADEALGARQRELLQSEGRLAQLIASAMDAIITVDGDQRIVEFNAAAEQMFRCPAADALGHPLDRFLPARFRAAHREHLRTFGRTGTTTRRMGALGVVYGQRADGEEFPIEAAISQSLVGGQPFLTAIVRDVTERQRAEVQQQRALREKELLQQEVHHRVKNNLQIIASLLDLQAELVEDPRMRTALQESQQRIHTMALLHESLQEGAELARVYAPEYLSRLCTQLYQVYGAPTDRLALRVAADPVWLEVPTAIPCGLILQELLSNAFKHGFLGGQAGTITVSLQVTPAGEAVLTVRDMGVGFSEGLEFRQTESLGLQLTVLLTEQLGGTIRLERGQGTQWTLTFPDLSAQGHEPGEAPGANAAGRG